MTVNQPSLGAQARAGARWQGFAQVVDVVLGFGVLLLLARLVKPSEFGLVALVTAVAGIVTVSLNTPITGAIVTLRLTQQRSLSTTWWISVVLCSVLSGGIILFVVLTGFSTNAILVTTGVGLSVPLLAGANVVQSILQQRLHFQAWAGIRISALLITSAVAIVLALDGANLIALVSRSVVPPCVMIVIGSIITGWRPRIQFDRSVLGRVINYSRGIVGYNLLNQLIRRGDDVLVGTLLGSQALGLYSLSYRFLEAPIGQVSQLAVNVALPTLVRIPDPAAFRSAFLRSQKLLVWFVAPVGVCSMAVGDVAVVEFLGHQWRSAGPVIQIFGAIALIQAASTQVGVIYFARRATDLLFRWQLIAAPVVAAAILFGLQFGIVGVAWAYLVANLVLFWPSWAIPGRLIDLSPLDVLRSLSTVLGWAFVVAGAGLATRELLQLDGLPATVASIAVLAIVYWVGVLALDRDLRGDVLRVVRERAAVDGVAHAQSPAAVGLGHGE